MSNEIKNIAAPTSNLGDVILTMRDQEGASSLDRVRNVLALRMNQYSDIKLTETESRRIARAFHDIEAGSATNLVMICSKENCPYATRCALYDSDNCPEGKECLHENYMLIHYMNQYLESLEVDVNNMPEMVLINQLVEYEVIEYRCNAILSDSHKNLTWTRVVGLDKQGEIVEAEETSYALTIKLLVQKNKFQILQEFTATRREKYKKQAALKESKEGPSKQLSFMKSRINEIKKGKVDIDEVHSELNAMSDPDLTEQ